MAKVKHHNVDIGDDRLHVLAQCSCGWSFKSPKRNLRLAAAHRHVADSLEEHDG